jgi:hypothetical protein
MRLPKIVCTIFLLAISATSLMALTATAVELPSDEDVTVMVKRCSIGRLKRIQGDVEGKIRLWKRQAEVGAASIEDLGSILSTVDRGQQISPEVYKGYTDCIAYSISRFLKNHASNDGQTTINVPGGVAAESNASPPPAPSVFPSRIFSGPAQYPPTSFAAYGIVAFKSRPTPDEVPRYQMICDAYIAVLLHYTEVQAPLNAQMVTVWPIDTNDKADSLNKADRTNVCKEAVPHYGLVTALTAMKDANQSHADLRGEGPFLLAWSPAGQKGAPDALVLVVDLSNVTTPQQAKDYFSRWSDDIQQNTELWKRGWNMEKLVAVIRLWADKWGPQILQVFGAKG